MAIQLSRRRVLLSTASMAALVCSPGLASVPGLVATPSATEGPFYPDRLPLDRNNDLVVVDGGSNRAKGEIFHLMGQLRSIGGRPVSGAKIEIWQCDANGVYLHSGDRRNSEFDPNFQGFGETLTDNDGMYRFRTITPVRYTGRTPHIHFKVKDVRRGEFTSQLYLADHPGNEEDFLYRRLGSKGNKLAASVRQVPAPEIEKNAVKGRFDIVLK